MKSIDVSTVHEVKQILTADVFYPPHEPRKATPAYQKAHKYLVDEKDLPCLVCGVSKSTLSNPTINWAGSRQLETHHRTVEWALANAIDLDKFNARIVAYYRAKRPSDPIYDHDFTQQEMLDWIDHSLDNLWVLCDVHHRHKMVGIHEVPYPLWGPQDMIKTGYKYTPNEVIGKKI